MRSRRLENAAQESRGGENESPEMRARREERHLGYVDGKQLATGPVQRSRPRTYRAWR